MSLNGISGTTERRRTPRHDLAEGVYGRPMLPKNAKSPFPGMKKEASIYIRPAALKVAAGRCVTY